MELLAPAKNLELAKAVLSCGADAVYFGGKMFGARAYADNFETEEILKLLDYCHLFGKKAYMTVNTLLKDDELEKQLYRYITPLYRQGLDAVLVQDLGVFSFLRKYFPQLPVHVSTQMNVTSPYGASFLKEYGAKRIVLARELSLAEISDIHRLVDVELEVFVHGALCVCYSGQCLMSSMIGGRSGNRGACGQACRLPYSVSDDTGRTYGKAAGYPLSTKDLCGIDDLPALKEAGVTSLKIEGRMKGLSYATAVTSIYRKYLDLLDKEGAKDFWVEEEDKKRLLSAGNRSGFTNAYYRKRNDASMMSLQSSAHRSEASDRDIVVTPLLKEVDAGVLAITDKPLTVTFSCPKGTYTAIGPLVAAAERKATQRGEIEEKLLKIGDYPFIVSKTDIVVSENAFVPMKVLNDLRRKAMEGLYEKLLSDKRRTDTSLSGEAAEEERSLQHDTTQFLNTPSSEIPSAQRTGTESTCRPQIAARVTTKEQLSVCIAAPFVTSLLIPSGLWQTAEQMVSPDGSLSADAADITAEELHANEGAALPKKEPVFVLPEILRSNNTASVRAFVASHPNAYYEASSYDGLGLLLSNGIAPERISCGLRLYAWSDRTKRAFLAFGFSRLSVPVELSFKELLHRDNRNDRMLVYGRIPLMLTANCIKKCYAGCDKKKTLLYLTDQKGYTFPVINDCSNCTNTVYNSLPLSLFKEAPSVLRLAPGALELSFVTEDKQTVTEVLSECLSAFYPDASGLDKAFALSGAGHSGSAKTRSGAARGKAQTTKGHFRRGVKE